MIGRHIYHNKLSVFIISLYCVIASLRTGESAACQSHKEFMSGLNAWHHNNKIQARLSWEKAAINNDLLAQYNLALMYFYGWGGPKNIKAAYHLFSLLAQHHIPAAQAMMGYILLYSMNNKVKGRYWMMQACHQHDLSACSFLKSIKNSNLK